MAGLTDEERDKLRDAIRSAAPDWYRAYELRQEGLNGRELAEAFDLKRAGRPTRRTEVELHGSAGARILGDGNDWSRRISKR